jgi:hypothetical protein
VPVIVWTNRSCKHTNLICAKHYAQFSGADLILNLLGEQTRDGYYGMFHIYVQHCPGTQCSVGPVLPQVSPCFFQALVLIHQRCLNRCCFVRVHLIKLTLNTDARFKRYQQLNTIHFLRHWVNWSKTGRDGGAPNAHAHGKWLEQTGTNMDIWNTLWKCSQPNVCFHSIFRVGRTVCESRVSDWRRGMDWYLGLLNAYNS